MHMRWASLLFAHWPVPAAKLRPLVPPTMTIDEHDGTAWVGLVPFGMAGVRPNGLPSVPWLSGFPEMNVRTYVRPSGVRGTVEDRPGVFFFSLDCHQPIAVTMARTFFHLNYVHASMRMHTDADGTVHYASRRTDRRAASADFVGRYRPTGPYVEAARGSLDDFLTRRACLYVNDRRGRLMRGEIDHPPWELASAEWDVETETAVAAARIDHGGGPPRLAAARPVDVRAWRIRHVTAPCPPAREGVPGESASASPIPVGLATAGASMFEHAGGRSGASPAAPPPPTGVAP